MTNLEKIKQFLLKRMNYWKDKLPSDQETASRLWTPEEIKAIGAYLEAEVISDYILRLYKEEGEEIEKHEAIDLGLPSGLKWATCNVGATAPEEYGDYFAWGETAPYYEDGYAQYSYPVWKSGKSAGYVLESYQWCHGDDNTLTKYNTNSSYGLGVDNLTTLEMTDDAARVNLGGTWRMPTIDEWIELKRNCTWTWTTRNGINGRLVTAPNGNSIFLPAAGYREYTNLLDAGSDGYYWSSSLNTDYPSGAWGVDFYSEGVDIRWYERDGYYRYYGFSVRAVSE